MKALAATAGNFLNLTEIHLGGNQITDEGVKSLATSAGNFSNLKKISLYKNKIGDKGVKALAGAGNLLNVTEINL